jgi:glycosyltransferase involved in cell wall biosynthesis
VSPSPVQVSVVIPVYNGANYLAQAVDSALAQDHPGLEVLVVNDGSTDGGATAAVARGYGSRIRYLEKPNGGVASALNRGIEAMRGDWLSWLSHDDVYLPGKVSVQVARLAGAPPDAVLFSDYAFIDADGNRLGEKRFRGRVAAMRAELVRGDPVNGCTTLVSRRVLEEAGGFDVRLRTIQDYDLWFRLARRHPFVHVPEVLLLSRLHPAQGVRTISTHYAETVAKLSGFVDELTDDDLRAFRDEPPCLVLVRLALALKLRGFDGAAHRALDRGADRAGEEPTSVRLRFLARATACRMLTRKAKPGYWLRRLRESRRASDGGGKA